MDTYDETVVSSSSVRAWSAFVIGATVGAAAALILAPASGRDTRAYLKRRGNELGHDAMQRGRTALRAQSERVKSAVTAGWERAGSAIDEARKQGETAYREARESFNDARGSRQHSDPALTGSGYRTDA